MAPPLGERHKSKRLENYEIGSNNYFPSCNIYEDELCKNIEIRSDKEDFRLWHKRLGKLARNEVYNRLLKQILKKLGKIIIHLRS